MCTTQYCRLIVCLWPMNCTANILYIQESALDCNKKSIIKTSDVREALHCPGRYVSSVKQASYILCQIKFFPLQIVHEIYFTVYSVWFALKEESNVLWKQPQQPQQQQQQQCMANV